MAERLSVFQVPVGLSILTQAKRDMVVIVYRREGRAPHGKNKWPKKKFCILYCPFRKESIKWFTDNTNVVSIMKKGSMIRDLQNIAINILKICHELYIMDGRNSLRSGGATACVSQGFWIGCLTDMDGGGRNPQKMDTPRIRSQNV